MSIPTTMSGYPIFWTQPQGAAIRNRTIQVRGDSMALKSGSKSVLTAPAAPNPRREFQFICTSRSEIKALEDFFFDRQARLKPFWMPTWQTFFTIIGQASTAYYYWFQIRDWNYFANIWPLGKRFRYFIVSDFGMTNVQVVQALSIADGSYVNSDGEFIMAGAGAGTIGTSGPFTEANGWQNMGIRFVRFDTDDFVVEYQTTGVATVQLATVEVPLEWP